jgi:hypothetical protein
VAVDYPGTARPGDNRRKECRELNEAWMTVAEKREKPGAKLHAMDAIVGPFAARWTKTSVVGLLFAAIDCLTRSSAQHLHILSK